MCTGCGACAAMAPHIFNMDAMSGKAILLDSTSKNNLYYHIIFTSDKKTVQNICKACIAGAIKIG